MGTKYAAQQARAYKSIARKGTTCTWYKVVSDDITPDDGSPEFPTTSTPVAYRNVPIVFYPSESLRLETLAYMADTGNSHVTLFALIPGNVKFLPSNGDRVDVKERDGSTATLTVDKVNTTQPDLYPIIHEITFR